MFALLALLPRDGIIRHEREWDAICITTILWALIIGTSFEGLIISYVNITSIYLILTFGRWGFLRSVVDKMAKDLDLFLDKIFLEFRDVVP